VRGNRKSVTTKPPDREKSRSPDPLQLAQVYPRRRKEKIHVHINIDAFKANEAVRGI
jgi:hypothetical protein